MEGQHFLKANVEYKVLSLPGVSKFQIQHCYYLF